MSARRTHPETDPGARAWTFRGVLAVDALVIAAICASCTGCGGGSDDRTQAAAVCRPVTVALLGDSTQLGRDDAPGEPSFAPHAPGVELQADMDAVFGAGAVVVTNYAVSGTTAAQAPHVVADIVVANYGINDMRTGVSVADFAAAMRATGATLIETQSPIADRTWPEASFVAAARGLGLPVADVNAYVLALPGWQAHLHDVGVHPDDALYELIVDSVLAPAVAEQVAAVGCAS